MNLILRLHRSAKFCKTLPSIHTSSYVLKNGVPLTTAMPESAKFKGVKTYEDLYKFSVNNSDDFWGELAKTRLDWYKPFSQVSDCDMNSGNIKWFDGGKLNVSVNCVDRHAAKHPDKVALIWEKDEPGNTEKVTYSQLLAMVCKISNCLKDSGVKRGDRVAIYMPVSPIAVAAMLACTRIGAVHSVVFAGFSADALAQRIQDAGVETILTTDQGVRGGKVIELKKTVDAAVQKCPSVKRVFVSKRTGENAPKTNLDIDLDAAMKTASENFTPEVMDSEDLLFMLYTSGSTGKPKGIVHTQAGYLLYASMTQKYVFDYHDGDIFGCVADIGWITGHSYVVYGPLSNGATTVLFESIPTYPDPGRYWEMVERLKINQFYGAPTAIRLLLRYGDSFVKKYDRSSLKVLGSVGEPINHEAWEWYHNVVGDGKCDVVDTWWQTETGGIAVTPRPSGPNDKIIPAAPMRAFFGIQPAILGSEQEDLQGVNEGALCIKNPWPGMARTIYGDHERFMDTYYRPFPGHYFSGDGAKRDEEGFIHITGRMDDVLNISGHRLGTAEVEDVLDEHPDVAEAAVVGVPHAVKGEEAFAFVTVKENFSRDHETLVKELQGLVRERIASFAVPSQMLVTEGLPKTRSGKIMRRILRKVAAGQVDDLGDISTLADPTVVQSLSIRRRNMDK
uniref:acetyl-coenzyme A synthetase 2-like, mitochondrial n=1 Tax=Ciona intestinalis TaxID=7719 RepID=UPI000180BBA6|nr:acetyl-coenzyme A synthetase 2-like, mitochondrial [Ciona intestinalis]|eukprot:XP_009861319.2 acetyl-coenzyme A synthetase 2-like, mitochondrial [Ciona intestinalis]